MKYQSDKIESLLKGATVAASAGFSTADWVNHVFVRYGEDDMVGNSNIGRLPIITIREVAVDYTFEAEPDHINSRDAEYLIRIYTPTFANRSETKWLQLQSIKQAALKVLTDDSTLGATDVRAEAAVITQYSIYQDIRFTTNSSNDENYSEGN
jgi:hypothetical protein